MRLTNKHFLSSGSEDNVEGLDGYFHYHPDAQTIFQGVLDGIYANRFSGDPQNSFIDPSKLSDKDVKRSFTLRTLFNYSDFDEFDQKEYAVAEHTNLILDALDGRTLEEAADPMNMLDVLHRFMMNLEANEQLSKSPNVQSLLQDDEEGEEEDEEEESGGEQGGEQGLKPGKTSDLVGELDDDTKLALSKLEQIDAYNFNVDKQRRFIQDPEGQYVVNTETGTVIEEVLRNPFATMDEHFAEKAMTSTFDNKTRYKVIEEKQSVILLIDDSGSMERLYKRAMVKAVMLYLMDKMLDDKLDLYIGLFESEVHTFDKITKENCREYFKNWENHGGGNTEVGEVIEDIQRQIKEGVVHSYEVNPLSRIIVVNDGQDTVKLIDTIAPVNAISLEVDNKDLKELCQKSGGVYVHYEPTDDELQRQFL